ncbi:MAG: hypothetical protein ACFCVE_03390 [Phycisphaerae bacterium]
MSSLSVVQIKRVAFAVVCFAFAVAIGWRGNTYNDALSGFSFTVPLMCVVAAVVFGLTGLGIAFSDDEQPGWQE